MALRVLYLSQWFPPENGARGLQVANGLAERGFEVEVLTGFPNYPSGKVSPGYRLSPYMREVMDGITIHRVYLHPSHDSSSLGRALNYLSFFVSALVFCLFNARRFDVIYVYHPPITVGLAAALSRYITRRPYILEVQDLWPDSVAASGMNGTFTLARILSPICRFVYQRAAAVLGQSDGMTRALVERGVAEHRSGTLFNWANESFARANDLYDMASINFEGRFNFVYGGNLGAVQGLESLIQAAHKLSDAAPEIQLTLVGDGTERKRLLALVEHLEARNVQILPAVPQSHIGDILAAADVLVTHLKDDPLFEITIPSKTQFYLAMGKPVLVGVRGESSRIVTDAGAGMAMEPENVDAIAQALLTMSQLPRTQLDNMGINARLAYDARFSFEAGMSVIASRIRKETDR
ncbi:glycosyltransferase family 4 protein [Brevundimonas naejangsanensis]|uniref:glycosyltransferase family 4 protein n=1 Tax=Brevundimonas naejangsanensis TaxID=588932 RepID=UPI00106A154A|nr:glycosyltransferase family 4 protein [Brevundimonas naejangsanensis]QBQ47225.1 glycosyltransferase WbuB [Brevundimonas naejangsanensis]